MRKREVLVWTGFGWACLVAFSRIVMGAHYLTDTAVGFAVGLTAMLLVYKTVCGREERQQSVHEEKIRGA